MSSKAKQHHHNSGSLKQTNKKHKAGAASKRSKVNKFGRVEDKGERVNVKVMDTLRGKEDRINTSRQKSQSKRDSLNAARRLGGGQGAPKIIGLISLCSNSKTSIVHDLLLNAGDEEKYVSSLGLEGFCKPITIKSLIHKQRFTILEATREVMCIVDVAKVADILIFVANMEDGNEESVDELGDAAMTAIRAQGVPTVFGYVHGFNSLTNKNKSEAKKFAHRLFETEFGTGTKVVEEGGDGASLLRVLASIKLKELNYRTIRSYMLGNEFSFVPNDDGLTATVQVSGYIRGGCMNVNRLVHITGGESYQLQMIESAFDPLSLKKSNKKDCSKEVLAKMNDELVSSLDAFPEDNVMDGEQTWPTEEEMDDAKGNKNKKDGDDIGASWLEAVPDEEEKGKKIEEEKDDDDDDDVDDYDDDGMDEDAVTKSAKREEEKEHLEFPDEVAVPENESARVRFARYRGMQSFRTSLWDPKESLPLSYKRIFQFQNFARTQRSVLLEGNEFQKRMITQTSKAIKNKDKGTPSLSSGMEVEEEERGEEEAMEEDNEGEKESKKGIERNTSLLKIELPEGYVLPSGYVTLHIKNVSLAFISTRQQNAPLIISSLLEHEEKMSVLNFNVQRLDSYQDPIKSKDPLDFHMGFRRFSCRPIYSMNNLNCDKHKFERFFNHGGFVVATVFAPICFTPCPVLIFKDTQLVANGSLLSIEPDRIVLKRIILTGAPHKCKKKKAVVRDMFYDPDDIRWFKPVELTTKFGLTGHIREPLGTHGSMKCIFNKVVKNHDTVCLYLYKRIYPKFIGEK